MIQIFDKYVRYGIEIIDNRGHTHKVYFKRGLINQKSIYDIRVDGFRHDLDRMWLIGFIYKMLRKSFKEEVENTHKCNENDIPF